MPTSSTRGRRRERSPRWWWPAVSAAGCGTTPATSGWTSPASWSTSTSGTSTPAIVAAIQEQAAILTTISPPTANLARGEAAKRIVDLAPDGFNKVFFTNGGADANENAIRMARQFTGRDKVVSTYRSYHGNTGSAVVATGDWRRVPNEYARAHVHVFGPYLYRSEFWATTPEEESERALHHLRRVDRGRRAGLDRRDPARDDPRHRGRADAAAGLPRGRASARRQARHHAHPRRGDGRVRPHGPLVRVRCLRRRARPDHVREGRQLRLHPGRWRDHQRPDRRPLRRHRVPGRTHLQRPSAGDGLDRRVDRRDGRGGHRRQRRPHRSRRARAGPRGAGRQARP